MILYNIIYAYLARYNVLFFLNSLCLLLNLTIIQFKITIFLYFVLWTYPFEIPFHFKI